MNQYTVQFERSRDNAEINRILSVVYRALSDKGYDPVNQIVGYMISGDPTYITGYNNARSLIRRIDRNELLEELVDFYLKNNCGNADEE
ncbi:MAG: IreB family regulatory phosphoprotein [Oscillospiraceae bacterium]|nr:MAG: IreB family regulatory phosphoprotein [Oscillospiraceae bacterium]